MLGDWVRLCATGGGAERLLQVCARRGIPVHDIGAVPGGICFTVPVQPAAGLEAEAIRWGIEIKRMQSGGPGRVMARWRGRYGLLAGLALFAVLMRLFGTVTWSVKYIGFTQQNADIVAQVLRDHGLNEGQTVTQQKLRAAEDALMQKETQFGWISLNFKSGRLVAEATRAEAAPAAPAACRHDLIACADARIVALDVQSGFTCVQAGQTVAKGDALVATTYYSRLKEAVFQPAQGTVTGQFEVAYQAAQPLEYAAGLSCGPVQRWIRLQCAGREFTVNGAEQTGPGTTTTRGLTLGRLALPVTVVETVYRLAGQERISLSRDAAEQFALYRCRCGLWEQYPDAQVLHEQWHSEVREGMLYCSWQGEIQANIAVEGTENWPLGMENQEG